MTLNFGKINNCRSAPRTHPNLALPSDFVPIHGKTRTVRFFREYTNYIPSCLKGNSCVGANMKFQAFMVGGAMP